jgi:hypothetical protein
MSETKPNAVVRRISEDSLVARIWHPNTDVDDLDPEHLGQAIIDAIKEDRHVWTNDELSNAENVMRALTVGKDVTISSEQIPRPGHHLFIKIFGNYWRVAIERLMITKNRYILEGKVDLEDA